ncbi:YheC/YheD family protein [Brevibacillus sp. SYP-B805]|uniref:YheC/YheD family endospore coat-associated protein n=1 Tax=Brevibacillus sp. SYP-B805 TaxID=1578199 RepID=UPI0013EDBC05|nr:YheC/YheD family protein [Brevibacillus sp. SYP-B805]NGQ97325.1 YheC/YheD family protein [Brevibacillus sp. SYP-B805]
MKRPIIGILTWRRGHTFAEPRYFRQLIRAGRRLGCTVFLFSPRDVHAARREVNGFVPNGRGGWSESSFPWPDVVIDRYRYSPTEAFRQYAAFRRKKLFRYANNRLANKWKVHRLLMRDERMHRWLPESRRYDADQLRRMAARYPVLYVKPVNGTGGRGILRIERNQDGYLLLGRDRERAKRAVRLRRLTALTRHVDRWVNKGFFMIQQGLRLQLIPQRAVDMRLLIQKDETGQWQITGHGIRIGGERSATSNLHGGGRAADSGRFLQARFGAEKTQAILAECEALAFQTAETVEHHFGRMLELGLDIGIDEDGRVWLIEINPKPGREILKELGKTQQYRRAIQRPLQYAMHVARAKSEV